MRGSTARVWLGWLVVVGVVGLAGRTVIALPERCEATGSAPLEAAASAAVAWFDRNQLPDGTWRYRLDLTTGEDLGGYNWVRHAGVLLSLEQAAAAGVAAAAPIAQAARPAIFDRLVPFGDRLALDDAGALSTGGTALLTVALGERRLATGDPVDDERLRALGRYLADQVEPAGSVLATASRADGTPVAGTYSPFVTGQVLFALARLERIFPGEGFAEPVRPIGAYLARDRARREGYVPDASDHWAAYGLAEVVRWPGAAGRLTADELAFARKQMGILGIQVRYESQRTDGGVDRWLRGRRTIPAGLGTLGEGLWRWAVVAEAEPALAGQRAWVRDRLACTADLVADRQLGADEAAGRPDPAAAQGAWEQFGTTQMDDQQHALSTLLGGIEAAAPTPLPRRTPVPESATLVVLVALAALHPLRLAGQVRRTLWGGGAGGDRSAGAAQAAVAATLVGVALVGLAAVAGGPLLRELRVSVATALVAAGLVVTVAGLATLLRPALERGRSTGPSPDGGPALAPSLLAVAVARPEVLALAIAAGAGGQGWPTTVAVAAGVVAAWASAGLRPRLGAVPPGLVGWAVRAVAVGAVAGGVALVVDGVYAV